VLPWLAWSIAAASTGAFLLLWFRDVRRVMRERKNMLESAACQLKTCRARAAQARGDPEAAAVLERSESIYRQAVALYNDTLRKPCNSLPAYLMGYRTVS